MVVWGVPGSGKSHFARWLVASKGYVHAETDAGLEAALQEAGVALEQGRPAVIEWGVYVEPAAIATVRRPLALRASSIEGVTESARSEETDRRAPA